MMNWQKQTAELKTVVGLNPRPADFDEYWQRALNELSTVKPQVEMQPAAFQVPFANCYDVYYTGVRNARIHAKVMTPKRQTPGPALLAFHGYSGRAGDFYEKLGYVANGFTVALFEARGQGGVSEDTGGVKGNTFRGQIIRGLDDDTPDNLLFRHIFLDCAELAKLLTALPCVDPKRMGVIGNSQGGGLALACAALVPEIKLAAVAFPFLCDYRNAYNFRCATAPGMAYTELRDYFRNVDPRHEREDEIFTRLGYIDVQHLAPRIKARVMMCCGLEDQICPPETQFAAFNRIQSPKTVKFYPDFGHETPQDWFDMVMLEMLTI